jgi:hypothetical protein
MMMMMMMMKHYKQQRKSKTASCQVAAWLLDSHDLAVSFQSQANMLERISKMEGDSNGSL